MNFNPKAKNEQTRKPKLLTCTLKLLTSGFKDHLPLIFSFTLFLKFRYSEPLPVSHIFRKVCAVSTIQITLWHSYSPAPKLLSKIEPDVE